MFIFALFFIDPLCVAPVKLAPVLDNMTLFHVQLVTRHGQRTPLGVMLDHNQRGYWECDNINAISPRIHASPTKFYRRYRIVYDNSTYNRNCMPGDLTIEGMLQHKALGNSFKNQYIDDCGFLPKEFHPSFFYFASSYIERTFKSLQSFLTGLYPIKSHNEVFDVEMAGEYNTPLYANPNMCEEIRELKNIYKETMEYKSISEKYWPHLANAAQEMNVGNTTKEILKMCEWSIAMNCNPISSKEYFSREMIGACHEILALEQFFMHSLRPGVGSSYTYREMFHIIDSSLMSKKRTKFSFFSAHDTTLAALYVTLTKKNYTNLPPYASHLVSELYMDKSSVPYIRYIFNGEPVIIDYFNSSVVNYNEFRKYMDPLIDHCHEVPIPTL